MIATAYLYSESRFVSPNNFCMSPPKLGDAAGGGLLVSVRWDALLDDFKAASLL